MEEGCDMPKVMPRTLYLDFFSRKDCRLPPAGADLRESVIHCESCLRTTTCNSSTALQAASGDDLRIYSRATGTMISLLCCLLSWHPVPLKPCSVLQWSVMKASKPSKLTWSLLRWIRKNAAYSACACPALHGVL